MSLESQLLKVALGEARATISFFYCCFALSEWCCKRQEVTWKSHSMSWQLTPISGRRFNRQPFIDVPSYVILLHFPCFVKDFLFVTHYCVPCSSDVRFFEVHFPDVWNETASKRVPLLRSYFQRSWSRQFKIIQVQQNRTKQPRNGSPLLRGFFEIFMALFCWLTFI